MTEETAKEKLERLLEAEKTRATEARNLTLLLGGIVVIILSYILCF